jgi:hypothetical protein
LRTTAGNDCDFDHSGSHQISIAVADQEEESHDQEEGR